MFFQFAIVLLRFPFDSMSLSPFKVLYELLKSGENFLRGDILVGGIGFQLGP